MGDEILTDNSPNTQGARKVEIKQGPKRKYNAVCETQAPTGAGVHTVSFERRYIVYDENKTGIK